MPKDIAELLEDISNWIMANNYDYTVYGFQLKERIMEKLDDSEEGD
ncbi:MAG: hypothetical protein AABY22_19210 [Nanoarchaeota archaeon]